jgi:hypothetical protein
MPELPPGRVRHQQLALLRNRRNIFGLMRDESLTISKEYFWCVFGDFCTFVNQRVTMVNWN